MLNTVESNLHNYPLGKRSDSFMIDEDPESQGSSNLPKVSYDAQR